ncbi:unnamed protein product [Ixodes pacificus]
MDVVQVEGQELRPDEFGEGSGWCEIKRNKKRADSAMESAKTQQQGHQQTGATSTSGISTVADKAAKYRKKNARKVSQIAMASRMPDLPTDDYKVVVRPRGGFNVSDHKTDRIYCCLRSAAGIGREAAEEDSICLNVRQNVVVLSTPSEDRANKYGAITKLRIGEREYEASAYRAAPENTSKGLVRGISKDENPADIVRSLVTKRNPSVLHAKRMGNTDNVIVLFDGFHVPRYVYYGAMLVRCTLYRLQEADRRVSRVREAGTQSRRVPQPQRQDMPRVRLQQPASGTSVRAEVSPMRQRSRHGRPQVQGQIQDPIPGQAAPMGTKNTRRRRSRRGRSLWQRLQQQLQQQWRILLCLGRSPPGQRQEKALGEPRSERRRGKVPFEISRTIWCALPHRLPDLETKKQVNDARWSRPRRRRPRQPGR